MRRGTRCPGAGRGKNGFTLVELMVVIAILGLLVSVLATAVIPKMRKAKRDMDVKQLKDLYNELQIAMIDDNNKKKLVRGPVAEKRGLEFWEACFRHKILTWDAMDNLVSVSSQTDVKVDSTWLDDPDGTLPADACSWTGPQGNEVYGLTSAGGSARRICICYNSNNWNNLDGEEVLVVWSDGEVPVYVTFDEMHDSYGISQEQWLNPGGDLFGVAKPFDGVFD